MSFKYFPLIYQIAENRRCLFVKAGNTLSIGCHPSCQIRLLMDGLKETEARILVLSPASALLLRDGQPEIPVEMPFSLDIIGHEMNVFRPADLAPDAFMEQTMPRGVAISDENGNVKELSFHPERPLIIGAEDDCDFVVQGEHMPPAMAAIWPRPGNRITLHILDNSQSFTWRGEAAREAEDKNLPLEFQLADTLIGVHPLPAVDEDSINELDSKYPPIKVAERLSNAGGAANFKTAASDINSFPEQIPIILSQPPPESFLSITSMLRQEAEQNDATVFDYLADSIEAAVTSNDVSNGIAGSKIAAQVELKLNHLAKENFEFYRELPVNVTIHRGCFGGKSNKDSNLTRIALVFRRRR